MRREGREGGRRDPPPAERGGWEGPEGTRTPAPRSGTRKLTRDPLPSYRFARNEEVVKMTPRRTTTTTEGDLAVTVDECGTVR